MISLHITVYESDDLDRFKIMAADSTEHDVMHDVTDQYSVVALTTEDGREGFAIVKQEQRHETGAEL